MNTTINQSITDLVESFDTVAKIPALRGIVHSTMAKTIGLIRQDIRERARKAREDEADAGQVGLDQRNGVDEDERAPDEAKMAMGFAPQIPWLKQASVMHAVYDAANVDLMTVAVSKWDTALTPEAMLDYMITNTRPLDKELVAQLAKVAKCDTKYIEQMAELEAQREREQLTEAKPEILSTFDGFANNGYNDAIDELPVLVRHQLGIKVALALQKAKDNLLMRVLRTRRIGELGGVTLLDDAIEKTKEWLTHFETVYSTDLQLAADQGATLSSVDDLPF